MVAYYKKWKKLDCEKNFTSERVNQDLADNIEANVPSYFKVTRLGAALTWKKAKSGPHLGRPTMTEEMALRSWVAQKKRLLYARGSGVILVIFIQELMFKISRRNFNVA
ncbi:hypothetical protein EVAR_9994_1 [Eumeta japonica]|uniref:Uncharacterized protein n=1 Tax=Eumeta variegata TaxID=151549 RepID=A0A4C1TQZ9_EUMVA|nr:hypothetical protein EVAR_9994_1 [Eumeta japonica]